MKNLTNAVVVIGLLGGGLDSEWTGRAVGRSVEVLRRKLASQLAVSHQRVVVDI